MEEDILELLTIHGVHNLTEEQKALLIKKWETIKPEARVVVRRILSNISEVIIPQEEIDLAARLLAESADNWNDPRLEKIRNLSKHILISSIKGVFQ